MHLLLEEKNYTGSAQIGIEMMLQESNENQISLGLSLLSCWKYLNSVVNNPNAIVETDVDEEKVVDKDAKKVSAIFLFFKIKFHSI